MCFSHRHQYRLWIEGVQPRGYRTYSLGDSWCSIWSEFAPSEVRQRTRLRCGAQWYRYYFILVLYFIFYIYVYFVFLYFIFMFILYFYILYLCLFYIFIFYICVYFIFLYFIFVFILYFYILYLCLFYIFIFYIYIILKQHNNYL